MDTETCSLASEQISATQRRSDIIRPYRSPILPLFAMVECLIPSDRKPGGVLVVAKGTPRTFRSTWVGGTEESDEHLVVKNGATMCGEREQWFKRHQAQRNSFVSQT